SARRPSGSRSKNRSKEKRAMPEADPTEPVLSPEHLLALVELAPELAEDTSLNSLLDRLLARAVALPASTGGSAYLYDDRRRKLYVAHAVGPAAAVVLEKYGAGSEGVPIV